MKNLILYQSQLLLDNPDYANCTNFAYDNETGKIYFSNTTQIFMYDNSKLLSVDLKEKNLVSRVDSEILSIDIIYDQFVICVAITSGEIYFCNFDLDNFELMAQVSDGINSLSWSPELELCIVINDSSNILILTSSLDIVFEKNLLEDQEPECKNVNVGWGSKETQFHGSEGKQAAIKENKEIVKESTHKNEKPVIKWRDDGQYFLISFIHHITSLRQLQLFTREGVLHTSSNSETELGQAICFGPNNNLITTCKYKDKKAIICFLEKNALAHGQFQLPFDNINIKKLQFNINNTILAIHCSTVTENKADKILLCTTSNYHWYIKQCIVFDDDAVVDSSWSRCRSNQLYVFTRSGKVVTYDWIVSYRPLAQKNVTVGVFDGFDLMVTPFNNMIIPPPMCAYRIKFPTCIVSAAWDADNHLIILTDDNVLYLLCSNTEETIADSVGVKIMYDEPMGLGFKNPCSMPSLLYSQRLTFDTYQHPLALHHLTLINSSTFLFVVSEVSSEYLYIAKIDIHNKSITYVHKIDVFIEVGGNNRIIAVVKNMESELVVFELEDGTCWKASIDDGSIRKFVTFNGLPLKFSTPCSQIESICFSKHEAIIGLSQTYRLFINEFEIAQDCNSFAIHANYILWTTHTHLIKSFDREMFYNSKVGNVSNKEICEEKRSVERGSQIICVDCTKVVLQMPRGNLEVIHPRVLVFHVLKSHMEKLEYMEAFKLCRHHRINMNFLVDHDSTAFLKNLQLFVDKLETSENINLFLAALIKDDITFTMYKSFYHSKLLPNDWPNKLDDICNEIKKVLIELNESKYFISIITCDLRKTNSDLESALKRIKILKETEPDKAVAAVKYLFYLQDSLHIYNVALSTYDLQLAVIVAEQSQMDPKEYLPFLNTLMGLEENFMKYTIDLKLNKFDKALISLSKCGEEHFENCLKLITEHKLHSLGLNLYPQYSKQFKEIATLYATRLGEEKLYSESGTMYYRNGDFQLALSMFELGLRAQMCLCCAAELKYDAKQMVELARRLSGKLIDVHLHLEAASLLETYANDFEEAVVVLLSGHKWDHALALIYKYMRLDLLETNFKPSLLEAATNQCSDLDKTIQDFNNYLQRLTTVRKEKEIKNAAFENHGQIGTDDMSETSSVSGESGSVSQTSTSSKNSGKSRRASRRNKYSLRKGSNNEHIALIEALFNIIEQINKNTIDEVKSLMNNLLLFGKEKLALQMQTSLLKLLETFSKSVESIWPRVDMINAKMPSVSDYTFGPNSTSSSISASLANKSIQAAEPNLSKYSDMPFMIRPILKPVVWKNQIVEELINDL